MISVLVLSCTKVINSVATEEENKSQIVEIVINFDVLVAIVDEEYNDLLNPELPNYLGDEYTNGIEVLYLAKDKKISWLEYFYATVGERVFYEDELENYKVVSPPYRYAPGYGKVNYGTLGKYFINCTSKPIGSDFYSLNQIVTHTYIRYPDGKEDEIKVEIFQNETHSLTKIGKLWVNGELAFDLMKRYYNPEYFPFMKPVLDDEGNYMGFDMPETPDFLVWLVKTK